MSTYLCFIHVRPGSVPQLRTVDGEDDSQIRAGVALALGEWPLAYQVEVMDGDRLVFMATGAELNVFRSA